MARFPRSKGFLWGGVFFIILFCVVVFILPLVLEKNYSSKNNVLALPVVPKVPTFVVTHLSTPEPMKALYMTACVAGTNTWRDSLRKLINDTELNAVVIDIKDYSGTVSIEDENLQTKDASGCKVKDLMEFIGKLHEDNIYVIGRITVFQDPYYASRHPELAVQSKSSGGVWKDHKGLAFVDVGAKEYWDYIVRLSKASYKIGFDEINYDYIRYPSDGNMADALYTWTVGTSTKPEMLESFFSYLHNNMKDVGVKISADLFGLTTLALDDMGIGQELERTLPYFDYVYPMVYPSHYAWNTGGFGDPATHPYEIVKYSMTSAVAREQTQRISLGLSTSTPSKLRPWLQDFDLGANYGVPEVQAQIKATYDSGLTGWLVWDAGNKYTKEAYLAE